MKNSKKNVFNPNQPGLFLALNSLTGESRKPPLSYILNQFFITTVSTVYITYAKLCTQQL